MPVNLDALLRYHVINECLQKGIAYHIYNIKDIDNALKKGEYSLIDRIARGHGVSSKGKEKHFYSFASKYCSFHNPEKFAIYDMLIQDLLVKYY